MLFVLVVVNARPEGEQVRVDWLGEVLSVEVAALCTRCQACGEEISNGWHEVGGVLL